MTDSYRKMPRFGVLVGLVLAVVFIDGCSCEDEFDEAWEFEEFYDEDREEDDDWDWAFPDSELDPDPPSWEETAWETEIIEDGISDAFADNDRTSVVVDRQGTLWLGYHRCEDLQCSDPDLVIGHQRYDDDQWTWERIEAHSGLFALEVIDADEPIVVYLDRVSRELKAATRQSDGRWLIEVLPVDNVGPMDGFDLSRDRTRYYVSHASSSEQTIEFLSYNKASMTPFWRRLEPLEPARSAAYERGLRGGNQENFFLVHQDNAGDYRLSEFDLQDEKWTRASERFPTEISSLLVRQNGELCTSGPTTGDLFVSCGFFDAPLERSWRLHGGSVNYLSSMIEARDETLFVAYHDGATNELYVARRPSHGDWTMVNAYDGETSGISTAIDHRDHVLMSFYHCQEGSCAVILLRRTP